MHFDMCFSNNNFIDFLKLLIFENPNFLQTFKHNCALRLRLIGPLVTPFIDWNQVFSSFKLVYLFSLNFYACLHKIQQISVFSISSGELPDVTVHTWWNLLQVFGSGEGEWNWGQNFLLCDRLSFSYVAFTTGVELWFRA